MAEHDTFREILERFRGRDDIGVNVDGGKPKEFMRCHLVELTDDHMVLLHAGLCHRIPYAWILRVVEPGEEDVITLGQTLFPVCIEIYHLVVYSRDVDVRGVRF